MTATICFGRPREYSWNRFLPDDKRSAPIDNRNGNSDLKKRLSTCHTGLVRIATPTDIESARATRSVAHRLAGRPYADPALWMFPPTVCDQRRDGSFQMPSRHRTITPAAATRRSACSVHPHPHRCDHWAAQRLMGQLMREFSTFSSRHRHRQTERLGRRKVRAC